MGGGGAEGGGWGEGTDYDGYFEHVERDRKETPSVIFARRYQNELTAQAKCDVIQPSVNHLHVRTCVLQISHATPARW